MIKVTVIGNHETKNLNIQELELGTVVELADGLHAVVYEDDGIDNVKGLLLIDYRSDKSLAKNKYYTDAAPVVKVVGKLTGITVEEI